ncbi:MAG: hypothetical protein JST50_23120 [Bacteroidetes bacterium]|nr:hypothetical protein [Bacteroidota bacterium]
MFALPVTQNKERNKTTITSSRPLASGSGTHRTGDACLVCDLYVADLFIADLYDGVLKQVQHDGIFVGCKNSLGSNQLMTND